MKELMKCEIHNLEYETTIAKEQKGDISHLKKASEN